MWVGDHYDYSQVKGSMAGPKRDNHTYHACVHLSANLWVYSVGMYLMDVIIPCGLAIPTLSYTSYYS